MLLAEQLVGEARERRRASLSRLERTVYAISAVVFVATVVAMAPPAQAQQTIGTNLGAYTPNANFNCTVAPGFEFSGFEMAPPGSG